MPTQHHLHPARLWRYNPVTGYWRSERECTPGTEEQWLLEFRKAEPDAMFKIARHMPKAPDSFFTRSSNRS